MTLDFVTNQEIVLAARARLDQGTWDYLAGGAESETTMRRNRLAFDRLAFRPRIMRDVTNVDASTTLLGQRIRMPLILAPVGYLEVFHPDGGAGSAWAAGEFGTLTTVSSVTAPGVDAIAACTTAPKLWQQYVMGDRDWMRANIERAIAAGYAGLVITADIAALGLRDRTTNSRWRIGATGAPFTQDFFAGVTWDLMDEFRAMAPSLPFVLKGVATPEDAAIAVEHGVDAVWVSNHGGRQLDHGVGTLELLPEVVAAVAGRAQIILDGGIQRGSDIVKAVALGATAVAIGKLQGWGLAAGGGSGVLRVLEILEAELLTTMRLLGVKSIAEIDKSYLRAADPVSDPHEMSAWVNMATPVGTGGRLL